MQNEPTNEQLAEWIEKGLGTPQAKESQIAYFAPQKSGVCLVCALSLGVIGKIGFEATKKKYTHKTMFVSGASKELGISYDRAKAIEDAHLSDVGAAEIAQMLRRGEI